MALYQTLSIECPSSIFSWHACDLCLMFLSFCFLCSRWSFVDVPLNFSCLGYNTASDAWIPTLIVVCIFTLLVIRVGKIIYCILIIGGGLI